MTKLGFRHQAIARRGYLEAKKAHKAWVDAGRPMRDTKKAWKLRLAVVDPAIVCVVTAGAGIEGEAVLLLQFLAKKMPDDKRQEFFRRFLSHPDKPKDWRTRPWEASIKPHLAIALLVLGVPDFDWALVQEVMEARNVYVHPKGVLTSDFADSSWYFDVLEDENPDKAMKLAKKAHEAAKHAFEKFRQAHKNSRKLPQPLDPTHVEALLSGRQP